jgi:Coenzyme PQQ synthesis protein D (PqqD)
MIEIGDFMKKCAPAQTIASSRGRVCFLSKGPNLQISENVRAMINQDGGILMDIEHGTMISLNICASQIWKKLQQKLPLDQIIEDISVEFQISRATAQQDVQDFLDSLQKHGLLRADGGKLVKQRSWLARMLERVSRQIEPG